MVIKVLTNLRDSRRLKAIFICLIIVGAYLIWNSISPTNAASLTDQDRTEMIDSVASILANRYVYPEKAIQMDSLLKSNLSKDVYDSDSLLSDFTKSISDDLREFSQDLHIRIRPIPENRFYATEDKGITSEQIYLESLENFGWEKAEILPGAIGYISVDAFKDTAYAGETAEAALGFIANSQAVIIDLQMKHACGYTSARGSSGLKRFYLCLANRSTADIINYFFDRNAHGYFDKTCIFNFPNKAEDFSS